MSLSTASTAAAFARSGVMISGSAGRDSCEFSGISIDKSLVKFHQTCRCQRQRARVAQGADCADERSTQRCRSGQTGRSRNALGALPAHPVAYRKVRSSAAVQLSGSPGIRSVPNRAKASGANLGANVDETL
jgi:hypothetical protein